jgi:hypothetical protein
MEKLEIKNAIENMNSVEIMDLNNRLCDELHYSDNFIYANDEEFLEMFDKINLVQRVCYGDYNYSHDFVWFNGYGNFQSDDFLTADNLPDLLDNMVDEIYDNFKAYSDLF